MTGDGQLPRVIVERSQSGVSRGATLQSIADEAGVHVSTVSRALSGKRDRRVSEATANRIQAIAAAHGFEPNPWARSLRTNRTFTIGLVIPRLVDNVLAVVFESAEQTALDRGYQAVTVSTDDDLDREQRAVQLLVDRRVDGIILATARRHAELPGSLSQGRVPFVLLNRCNAEHPCFRADDVLGGYIATRHLLKRGHSRIAHIAGIADTSTSEFRLDGYRRALTEAGVDVDPALIEPGGLGIDGGYDAAIRLLSRGRRPTAMFATNDYVAIGVMAAARDLGLAVPRDVAVVGYNDTSLSRALAVPLSSVSVPLQRMGSDAVAGVIDLIETSDVTPIVYQPRLRVRESSAITYLDDEVP